MLEQVSLAAQGQPGVLGQLVIIFLAAAFTDNILLSRFLGMCSFLAISRQMKTSIGLGIAVVFVTTCTAGINYLVHAYVTVPLGIEFLEYIIFIVVIAAFVQLVEMVVERFSPPLYFALGIFLPLITVNCAILGVSLFMLAKQGYGFWQSLVFGAGSGIGWMLAIVLMAGIRSRIREDKVPEGLRGAGITLIVSGIIALAFVGFSGMIKF
ncbi:MAG: NADH:ubiquinone reductase (Na(+)-transporting) subunit E [Lentisphaerae bacterium]|jgi:Na+-transporting NADH:ubiquinone oxidoreductase subunit E|nr:NADH:ubiquinone reductase (Na(+)-transporting) subunit E [Lentisphaerota bacterium]MBT4820510.1 NADH:ubiquinone reductase (Na(+)-transporting) subunit E [Lentisphaerota bacterium]MBT5608104.1 NADH:ubiquinone reductase (Na(+)-transporting) subunit E [Lentisphaerota bacterium]MBT7060619.1 NADH:ubiquinone reductase (Na(+)-transporting) subunit E [Lentisphaerota bacterium]MBT7847718.1 NADH:ubiquinone reductase (Na(+)-transporting) subunit E [Lentisphaerota bacterium]